MRVWRIKMQELISVIVPVYNVEPYLVECLDSIINQSYKNLEIILVDDGSTDQSGQICDRYGNTDKRIEIFHTPNTGLSAARNLGLTKAKGKYIGFVDSDDVIDSDMYKMLYWAIKYYEAQVAEGRIVKGKNVSEQTFNKSSKKKKVYCYTGQKAVERNLYPDLRRRHPDPSVCSRLYKREIISDLRFPEGRLHEDYLFTCQALIRCQNYCFVNEALYFYRMREGSITHRAFSEKDMDRMTILKERTAFLQESGEEILAALSRAHEYLLLFSYFYQATKNHMEIADDFARELYENKMPIIKSKLSIKRKIIYMLFYLNPSLYISAMDAIKKHRHE